MASLDERQKINRLLGQMGLSQLEDVRGLLAQVGFLIKDHDQYRELLVRQKPEERFNMYECLRGFLHFEPKPLDVYLAEAGEVAERKQLPTIDDDGKLKEFRVAEIGEKAIHNDMAWNKSHKILTLTCSYCTKEGCFTGDTLADAVVKARKEGWVYTKVDEKEYEVCPKCSKARGNA